MDVKKIPIILRFKLSDLDQTKIDLEVKKIEEKISKLESKNMSVDDINKEIGNIDDLANEILKRNNGKINVIKKTIASTINTTNNLGSSSVSNVNTNSGEVSNSQSTASNKVDGEEQTNSPHVNQQIREMQKRLNDSMNNMHSTIVMDKKTGEEKQERVVAAEFKQKKYDDENKRQGSSIYFIPLKKNRKNSAITLLMWIFIGSWAAPLYHLLHLLVFASPFFIVYSIVFITIFSDMEMFSAQGYSHMSFAMSISLCGPVIFYFLAEPFHLIVSALIKQTNKIIDTDIEHKKETNPYALVLNHKNLFYCLIIFALIFIILWMWTTIMWTNNIMDFFNWDMWKIEK